MKSATIPPLRVTPDLRADVESVLKDGETLSNFVEASLKSQIQQRKTQQEFIARGMASRENAKKTGVYFSKEEVLGSLQNILDNAKKKA
ncbi:MAG: prevent-host-death protein [Gammaproteobacteria bacterium]|nr:prevent-host-death protein [Gammaproteobacteria bacterium]